MGMQSGWSGAVQVTCYSGRIYPDRPASFVWQGRKYEVKVIEKEWLEPGEKHFVVVTTCEKIEKNEKGEKRFEICYHKREDSWSLREI